MGRRADLEAGGGRFDSRRAQVTFFGHVGMVFSSIFTHVWTGFGGTLGVGFWTLLVGLGSLFGENWEVLGCVWEWFGDLLR